LGATAGKGSVLTLHRWEEVVGEVQRESPVRKTI
jgi:hypothetical protein